MNKMVFPALLVATVMVAGVFAFAPVEQATTVHTDITNSQMSIESTASATTAFSAANSATDVKTFTLDPDKAFVIEEIIIIAADNDSTSDGTDKIEVTKVTVDGVDLDIAADAIGTAGATLGATTEFLFSEVEELQDELKGATDKIVVEITVTNDATNGGTITPNVTVKFVTKAPTDTTLGTVTVA